MNALGLKTLLAIAACSLAGAPPAPGQASADGLAEAARKAIRDAWDREIRPFSESALGRIEIRAVERRNRLARDVQLVHAFAETSWWKHSRHYLLLLRPSESGFEVLYRYDGGVGGGGLEVRLVDLGVGARRFALEISDRGPADAADGDDATATRSVLALHLPESDRFAEVFRELTTYEPASPHGYASTLAYRAAAGAMKDIVVRTELRQSGSVVDEVESVFTWQESAYRGIMPLPEAWRAELPSRTERRRSLDPSPQDPE